MDTHGSRHAFGEQLRALELATLGTMELVALQLTQSLDALINQDVKLAALVIRADDQIDRRYLEIREAALALLAQSPVAEDLRFVAATLQIIRCVERMGDQCVNIAKLVPLAGSEAPNDRDLLDRIVRMAQLAHRQLILVKEALKTRHVSLARDLVRQNAQAKRLNRKIFLRAAEISADPEIREWAMFMILVTRAVERIGDNTVDIAEQAVFITTGEYRQTRSRTIDPPPPPETP